MSLNRQRILSELGSVMNQLKSADCGCMGKLFANQNQAPGGEMGAPLPTCGGCRRGVCHGHGYSQGYGQGAPCAGEPYSMGNSMNQPCMGHCNPSKLYAETYNYLNHNLMQPVMKEVYEDLKSINPENTLMNNPLGKEMGLSGNSGGMTPGNSGNMNIRHMSGMGSTNVNSQMGQSQPPMDSTGGMGPQIVNMIVGDSGTKSSNVQRIPQQDGQATGAMANASQSVPGEVSGMNMPQGFSQGQYNPNIQSNTTGFANPPTQFVSKDNMYMTENVHSNPVMDAQNNPVMGGTMSQGAVQPIGASMSNDNNNNSSMVSGNMHGMVIANPAVPQMPPINKLQYGQQAQGMMQNTNSVVQQPPQGSKPQYGHHTQGMMKFNEMFPGVTQGGDLGFDPMAIAIQMNPANKQHAAMDTMDRLMNGGPAGRAMDTAGNASINQLTNIPLPDAQIQQNLANVNQTGNQQLISQGQQQVPTQQNLPPIQTVNQQMVPLRQQQAINANAAVFPPQSNAMQQQQVYTAVTGQPMINQQQYQQQQLQKQMQVCQQQPPDPTQQYQQQQYSDPNTGTTLPAGQRIVDLNAQAQQSPTQAAPKSNMPQEMTKDPIFPADVSRNQPYTYPKAQQRYYDYNTLGQPVEMLPAKMFHPQEPPLPQTLSPQPPSTKLRNDYLRYSNVKSTVSKTSLAGVKPIGRTPSRSQLQHIYNQYKGSQSFTQQNVKPPVQGGSFSEGKLNVPSASAHPAQQVPVERVGGDTHANNQIVNNQTNKVEQVMGQIGDVPVTTNKPHGDAPIKPPGSPVPQRHAKLRNGLQDVVYTSYPSSAAWSFHGAHTYRPISVGYRFRNLK